MKELYESYSCEDFLQNDDFKLWLNGHDLENDRRWRLWFKEHPHAKLEADKARAILLSLQCKEMTVTTEMVDQQWEVLKRSLQHSIPAISENVDVWWRPHTVFIKLFGAAAVILICFFLGHSNIKSMQDVSREAYITSHTNSGQQVDIVLSDGTSVRLNAGSSLRYPRVFSGKFREVDLVGEAFFKVKKNEKMPFLIRSNEIITKVLGTEFNINAYPENKEVLVAVVSGKVAVKAKDKIGKKKQVVCLTQEEMVTFGREDKALTVSKFDVNEQVGWKDGILYFEKCDFITALKKMERWYGVNIQSRDTALELQEDTWRFSGKFQNKSLAYVLEAMSYPNRFTFKIENKIVKLNPR